MIELFKHLKPILTDLEQQPLDEPVHVNPLKKLFEKYSPFKQIDICPAPFDGTRLLGFHISSTETKRAAIYYAACHETYVPQCEGCQRSRYAVAKELVHTFDGKHQKTPVNKATAELLTQVIGRNWRNHDGEAELFAEIAAVEILARYPARELAKGGFHYSRCINSNDFSFLATQFGVPSEPLSKSFSDKYMHSISSIRLAAGIKFKF
jgi:hypothetical protein